MTQLAKNESMYYEAGFAAGLRLPIICTRREDAREGLPAGVLQAACIFWPSPGELRDLLTARIKGLTGTGPIPPQA